MLGAVTKGLRWLRMTRNEGIEVGSWRPRGRAQVAVVDSCWMLDSDSELSQGEIGETERDFGRSSVSCVGWGRGVQNGK